MITLIVTSLFVAFLVLIVQYCWWLVEVKFTPMDYGFKSRKEMLLCLIPFFPIVRYLINKVLFNGIANAWKYLGEK